MADEKLNKGFRAMDPKKQREIASRGGRAAHRKGTAHEWTHDEAVEAGQAGGRAKRAKKAAQA